MNVFQMLGIARLPTDADTLIPPDERLLVCEHLVCSITFRQFRAPGRACHWKRQWFAGSIAISHEHIIAFHGRRRLINTAFNDPRFSGISWTADECYLHVAHDAALYHDDWSGKLEYRFRTPEAHPILSIIRKASFSSHVTSS